MKSIIKKIIAKVLQTTGEHIEEGVEDDRWRKIDDEYKPDKEPEWDGAQGKDRRTQKYKKKDDKESLH